jgi:VWFA-related protein
MVPFVIAVLAAVAAAQEKPEAPSPPSPSPPPAGEERPTFPAQVEQVTVDVVVTDKKGNPIQGLTKDDFTVREDGTPQTITTFEAIELPSTPPPVAPPRPRVSTNIAAGTQMGRTFVVLFDDIHLTPFQAHRAKGAVGEFLTTGVREGDRVTLVATGGGVWWSTRMMAGREELLGMVKRLDGRNIPDTSPERMTDFEALRIHIYRDPIVMERVRRRYDSYGVTTRGLGQSEDATRSMEDPFVTGKASEVYYQASTRMRISLEVVERVLDSLATTKGRKSLILVSQGFIYDPNLDEFKRVVQTSRRSNTAIYFLDTRGLDAMPMAMTAQFGPPIDSRDVGALFSENIEASEGAESVAADSGGFSVKNSNDLNKGILRIANETRLYYLVGYNPTNTAQDGKFRKIDVKVAQKGVQIRARKGYYAPLAGGKSALDKKQKTVDPDIQAALDSPYEVDQIPLRMTAYSFDETLLGKAAVVVATDVDIRSFSFEEKEGRFLDTAEFLLIVAHRETGEFFRYDQKVDMKLLPATLDRMKKAWLPIVRDFELKPGGYQAKIVVRDKNSGRIGTVLHEFEVPDLASFRTSTPVLSDALVEKKEGEPGVPRPAMVVRREFAGGAEARLYCQVEVYGAAKEKKSGMPEVTMGYTILRPDGSVMTRVEPTLIRPTSLGKLSRLVGTSLEWATPGDYEMVLSLKDQVADKTIEIREPFRVVDGTVVSGS